MTNRTVSEGGKEPGYLTEVADAFAGRVLFITHDAHIGLAPKAVKIEDEVCILLGSQTPLVVRRKNGGHYRVVGEC